MLRRLYGQIWRETYDRNRRATRQLKLKSSFLNDYSDSLLQFNWLLEHPAPSSSVPAPRSSPFRQEPEKPYTPTRARLLSTECEILQVCFHTEKNREVLVSLKSHVANLASRCLQRDVGKETVLPHRTGVFWRKMQLRQYVRQLTIVRDKRRRSVVVIRAPIRAPVWWVIV